MEGTFRCESSSIASHTKEKTSTRRAGRSNRRSSYSPVADSTDGDTEDTMESNRGIAPMRSQTASRLENIPPLRIGNSHISISYTVSQDHTDEKKVNAQRLFALAGRSPMTRQPQAKKRSWSSLDRDNRLAPRWRELAQGVDMKSSGFELAPPNSHRPVIADTVRDSVTTGQLPKMLRDGYMKHIDVDALPSSWGKNESWAEFLGGSSKKRLYKGGRS